MKPQAKSIAWHVTADLLQTQQMNDSTVVAANENIEKWFIFSILDWQEQMEDQETISRGKLNNLFSLQSSVQMVSPIFTIFCSVVLTSTQKLV